MNYLESYVQQTSSTNSSMVLLFAWMLAESSKSLTIAGYAQSDEALRLHNDIMEDLLKVYHRTSVMKRKIYVENHRRNETSIQKFRADDTIRNRGVWLLDGWESYE